MEAVVVGAEVVEVDPEVDEVVASLAQVGTSNTITQVELVVLASIGHHNVTMGSETQQTMIEGSLEVKLPTIWTDEKQSRAEAERRGRLV